MLSLIGLALAANSPEAATPRPNRYIGTAKCKNCHKSEDGGNQYGVWKKSKHASAYELLGTEKAKKVGKEHGVAEPQKSEKCLKCHVTAYGEPKEIFKKGFDITKGVQCENCHGPGENHMRARFRAAAEEEDVPEGQVAPYTQVPEGEIISAPTRKVCYSCHNKQSPSFKNFCFYERMAKIRHLDPRKPRTKEERAAMLVCGCGDSCGCVDSCPEGGCGVPPKQ